MGVEKDIYKDSNVTNVTHKLTNAARQQNNVCWKTQPSMTYKSYLKFEGRKLMPHNCCWAMDLYKVNINKSAMPPAITLHLKYG